MQSPFPGMDPLIEASDLWGDFHENLIADLARSLSKIVPERYVVRINSRSYLAIDHESQGDATRRPDISVKRKKGREIPRTRRGDRPRLGTAATLVAPVVMSASLDPEDRETFLEIYDLRQDRQLITGIEVLSPSNKRYGSSGWELYLRKRRAFLSGAANFVEIDFLRNGRRMPMREPWPESPYYVLVARKERVPRCDVWPAYMLQPLPRVPIPLSGGDADVTVDLQPIVNEIYDRARYADDINYRRNIDPALPAREKKLL